MIETIIRYKAKCDKCGCVLNDIHLNNQFVNIVQLIDYARNGRWIVNKKECLCDMCREPRKGKQSKNENTIVMECDRCGLLLTDTDGCTIEMDKNGSTLRLMHRLAAKSGWRPVSNGHWLCSDCIKKFERK